MPINPADLLTLITSALLQDNPQEQNKKHILHFLNLPEAKNIALDTVIGENDTLLLLAIKANLPEVVEKLIELGAATVYSDENFQDPLIIATNSKCEKLALTLLKHAKQLDLSKPNQRLETALHCASANGQTEVVKALLEREANTFVLTKEQDTPLDLAIKSRHVNIAGMLLDAIPDGTSFSHEIYQSALKHATNCRVEPITVRLLDMGVFSYASTHSTSFAQMGTHFRDVDQPPEALQVEKPAQQMQLKCRL